MNCGRHRLQGFDYRANRWYFVTTVTSGRAHAFGRIEGVELVPTTAGKIAQEEIASIPLRRPNVQIPISVVMPNHVHLLVGLGNEGPFEEPGQFGKVRSASLATVVGGWKSGVTRRARAEGTWTSEDLWQRRYHDRVIRDLDEWEAIADYILWNPINWHLDPLSRAREPTNEEVNDWKRRIGL